MWVTQLLLIGVVVIIAIIYYYRSGLSQQSLVDNSSKYGHYSSSQPLQSHYQHHSHTRTSPEPSFFQDLSCRADQKQGPRSINRECEPEQNRERKKAKGMVVEIKRERENERNRERMRDREWEMARQMERDKEVERAGKVEQAKERGYEAAMATQTSKAERRLVRQNVLTSNARNGTGYGQPPSFNGRNRPRRICDPLVLTSTRSCDQATQLLYDLNTTNDDNDCPLPDSPAPPPYQSPSPDSEQAKFLLQRGHFPYTSPASQFTYHTSILEVMPDLNADLSGDSENQSSMPSGARQLLSPQFHSRSPHLSPHSPQSHSQSPVLEHLSNSNSNLERLPSVSSRRQREESSDPEQPCAFDSQTRPPSQFHTSDIFDSNSTDEFQFHTSSEVNSNSLSRPQSRVHTNGSVMSHHSTESRTHTLSTSGNVSTPLTPDQLKELDELIGGVEAMLIRVNSQSMEELGSCTQEMEGEEGGGRREESVEEEVVTLATLPNLKNLVRDDLVQGVMENSKVSQVDRTVHRSRGGEMNLREQSKALQRVPQRKEVKEADEGLQATSTGDSDPRLQGNPIVKNKPVKPGKHVEAVTVSSNRAICGMDQYGSKRVKARPVVGLDLMLNAEPNVSRFSAPPPTTILPPTNLLESVGASTKEKEKEESLIHVSSYIHIE